MTKAQKLIESVREFNTAPHDPEIKLLADCLERALAVAEFYAGFKFNEDEMYRDEGSFAQRTLAEIERRIGGVE